MLSLQNRFVAIAPLSAVVAALLCACIYTGGTASELRPVSARAPLGAPLPDRMLLTLPDVNQANAIGGGAMDCGPAATADFLLYWRDHGYPDIAPRSGDMDRDAQSLMASLSQCMSTDATGTGVSGVANGLVSYVASRGYDAEYVQCMGWRRFPSKYGAPAPPNIDALKQCLAQGGAVLLNFGWYTLDGSDYRRFGGHWVALSGFGVGADGSTDKDVLVVRDPSPATGQEPRNEYIRLKPLSSGNMVGNYGGLPLSSSGYHQAQSGLVLPRKASISILDAAVLFKPSKPGG